ncbi:hypothetical protein B0A55_02297 [Friedmanniomyces simplex]|uniref:Uncharacterized protein n=1 Tax=Friedmanniomyces simplex TaxID=329884 RepID=A0A4U0XZU0_9PEZI|nr:hypothetical protein B0A55_02297 [Friedmanniomyces simplex]
MHRNGYDANQYSHHTNTGRDAPATTMANSTNTKTADTAARCKHTFKLITSETTLAQFRCAACKRSNDIMFKCTECRRMMCSVCATEEKTEVEKGEVEQTEEEETEVEKTRAEKTRAEKAKRGKDGAGEGRSG